MDRIHQIVIYGNGNVITRKRHFPCRRIIAQFCLKGTGLYSSVKNGGISIDERLIGIVAGIIRCLTDGTIRIFQKMCVVSVGDFNLSTFAVRDLREAHIRIMQGAENMIGCGKGICRHAKDSFFGGGKGVFTLAFGFIQCPFVKSQFRCRPERFKSFLRDRHQLRIKPSCLPGDLCPLGIDPVPTGGIDGISRIFIPFQAGIDPDFFAEAVQLIRGTEGIPQHGGGFRQTAFECQECRQQIIQFCKIFFPIFHACIERSQIPAIFFVQFRTVFYSRFHEPSPRCLSVNNVRI